MNSKKLFLTSSGLSADMKKKFFDIIGMSRRCEGAIHSNCWN